MSDQSTGAEVSAATREPDARMCDIETWKPYEHGVGFCYTHDEQYSYHANPGALCPIGEAEQAKRIIARAESYRAKVQHDA